MKETIIMIQQGGILMIPLILCSITSVTVIIERLISLRTRKIIVPEVLSVIENIKTKDDISLALSVCDKHPGVFSHIIAIGLKNHNLPINEIKEEFIDQGRQEIRVLERGFIILETIAVITPILGLLGTVLGMIKVFHIISISGVGEATALSGGISEALITTAVGLSIGIPTLVFFNYFSHKSENFILDIEHFSNSLIKKIKNFKENDVSDIKIKVAKNEIIE